MFKRILVAVDDSACARSALAVAVDLAVSQKAHLTLLHVVDPVNGAVLDPYGIAFSIMPELTEQGWAVVTAGVEKAKAAGLDAVGMVVDGSPQGSIADFARRDRVDLIVIGSHGRGGVPRMLLGSVAEGVMRAALCPTLVVHATTAASSAASPAA